MASNVQLSSFIHCKSNAVPKKVELKNVPFPKRLAYPQGLTALYGFNDALAEISKQRQIAETKKLEHIAVNISVVVDRIRLGITHPKDVAESEFINFGRISAELDDMIAEFYQAYLKEELGIRKVMDMDFTRQKHIATRPDLLDKLLQEDMFKRIKLIVYPIEDGGQIRSVATLRDFDAIESVTVRSHLQPIITIAGKEYPNETEAKASKKKRKVAS